jgi:hypothetical protein
MPLPLALRALSRLIIVSPCFTERPEACPVERSIMAQRGARHRIAGIGAADAWSASMIAARPTTPAKKPPPALPTLPGPLDVITPYRTIFQRPV